MKKQPTKAKKKNTEYEYYKKWYAIAATVLVIIFIIGYLGRGWIRNTVVPGTVHTFGGNSVQKTLDQQYSALGNPLQAMGITKLDHYDKCTRTYANNFHIEVDCSAHYSAYSNEVSNFKPDLGVRAANLEQTLKANGWAGANTSITTLGENLSRGIDYTPDAAYQKKIGKTECLVDFNTAFRSPHPTAISGSVDCSRTYEILGGRPQMIFPD